MRFQIIQNWPVGPWVIPVGEIVEGGRLRGGELVEGPHWNGIELPVPLAPETVMPLDAEAARQMLRWYPSQLERRRMRVGPDLSVDDRDGTVSLSDAARAREAKSKDK
jgi:hypothetical protein